MIVSTENGRFRLSQVAPENENQNRMKRGYLEKEARFFEEMISLLLIFFYLCDTNECFTYCVASLKSKSLIFRSFMEPMKIKVV